MPFSPLRMLLFFLALTLLVVVVQFGLITIAFDKLGLSADSAYLLLITTLVGSLLNLPLFSIKSDIEGTPRIPPMLARMMFIKLPPVTDRILVTINVGGAVVPLAFSFYLFVHSPLSLVQIALAVAVVSFVVYRISGPIPGIGIGMPTLIAPLAAVIIATLLDPLQRASLAYIGGTLGVLVGADLLRLGDVRKLGTPVVSIGGAGTFDGVYITGMLAVLLA
ncbi:MAG: DUF1614 domain-containing protein [Sideroxydans sp.]|nr:DUF1614 domain-containing protein [Sideroxydans sp.]